MIKLKKTNFILEKKLEPVVFAWLLETVNTRYFLNLGNVAGDNIQYFIFLWFKPAPLKRCWSKTPLFNVFIYPFHILSHNKSE